MLFEANLTLLELAYGIMESLEMELLLFKVNLRAESLRYFGAGTCNYKEATTIIYCSIRFNDILYSIYDIIIHIYYIDIL